MEATVTTLKFKMGEDIPDWLLTLEPVSPTSVRGAFRFGADVDVIDAELYYMVVPSRAMEPIGGVVDGAGTINCNMSATSKPVRIIQAEVLFSPPGSRVPANILPYAVCIQPHATAHVADPVVEPSGQQVRRRWLDNPWVITGSGMLAGIIGSGLAILALHAIQ